MGGLHRHSSLHTHFRVKFGHEKEVLGTQKSLLAGRNGLTFDAKYLLDPRSRNFHGLTLTSFLAQISDFKNLKGAWHQMLACSRLPQGIFGFLKPLFHVQI